MTKEITFTNGLLTNASGSSLNNPSAGARAYTFVNGILTNVGQVIAGVIPSQLNMTFTNGLLTGYYIISGSSSGSIVPPGDRIWLASGQDANFFAYSYDGIDWIGINKAAFPYWISLIYKFGDTYYMRAHDIMYSYTGTSSDGISWVVSIAPIINTGEPIWNGTRYVTGVSNTSYPYDTVADSYDGFTWNYQGMIVMAFGNITWNGTMYVAMGSKVPAGWFSPPPGFVNTMAYSYDGLSWTGLGDSIFSQTGGKVVHNGTIWVAAGNGASNSLAYSYNGIDWTGLGLSVFAQNGTGICWNGTMFVAIGRGDTNNTIAYSYNGIDWTGLGDPLFKNSLGDNGIATSIIWDGSKFIVGGLWQYPYNGTNAMGYSYNGIDWTGMGLYPFDYNCSYLFTTSTSL
jgi:hypothetical protein